MFISMLLGCNVNSDAIIAGMEVTSITTTFPRKVYQQGIDFGQTLREAGMVPSCALVIT